MGAGSQGFGPSSTTFPGHKQGAGWEVELTGLEQVPMWAPGLFKMRTLVARPCHWAQEQNYFQRNTPKLILQQSGGPATELARLQAALPTTSHYILYWDLNTNWGDGVINQYC